MADRPRCKVEIKLFWDCKLRAFDCKRWTIRIREGRNISRQLRIAIDDIEIRSSVKVMAETFGRKLVAEWSTTSMFQILFHLNVPLLSTAALLRAVFSS